MTGIGRPHSPGGPGINARLFQLLLVHSASYPLNPDFQGGVEAISARFARFMASLIAR
jgi:hypothetical protein